MKKIKSNLIFCLLFLTTSFAICQIDSTETLEKESISKETIDSNEITKKVLKPIKFSKNNLSGLGLDSIYLKNEPNRSFFQKQLYKGKDLGIYIVSSESWTSKYNNFWFDEFIYIFSGSAKITPNIGQPKIFESRAFFLTPKGFKGTWDIQASGKYHYELSVISSTRADSSKISKIKTPQLISPSILSGKNIELNKYGLYKKTLAKGVELQTILKAEKPLQKVIRNGKEQLIYILSGKIRVADENLKITTFYTGDFFVLPKGFEGHWKSEGHGIIKYLTVEKVE